MRGLNGKVIVVAGGATGIGAATATRLCEEGARVLVGDINVEGAEKTASGLKEAGYEAEPFGFDISDEESCKALLADAKQRWGALNGLYNAAADLSKETLGCDGDVVEVSTAVIERTLKVNLMGFFFTSRHAIPMMLAEGGGNIVHTTSGVVLGLPFYSAYGASKGGVTALGRHIAKRWGREGIRSNVIDPGITLTDNQLEMNSDEHRDELMAGLWSPRYGEPSEVAAAVAFLLSDDARWINGQTYIVASMDGAR